MSIKEESLKNLAVNLRIRRKSAQLTQAQVAKLLGYFSFCICSL